MAFLSSEEPRNTGVRYDFLTDTPHHFLNGVAALTHRFCLHGDDQSSGSVDGFICAAFGAPIKIVHGQTMSICGCITDVCTHALRLTPRVWIDLNLNHSVEQQPKIVTFCAGSGAGTPAMPECFHIASRAVKVLQCSLRLAGCKVSWQCRCGNLSLYALGLVGGLRY